MAARRLPESTARWLAEPTEPIPADLVTALTVRPDLAWGYSHRIGTALRPGWSGGRNPGFSTRGDPDENEAREADELYAWISGTYLLAWQSEEMTEELAAKVRSVESHPAIVSRLMERASVSSMGHYSIGDSNKVVVLVGMAQGRFRPDVAGLFETYRGMMTRSWGDEPAAGFDEASVRFGLYDDEGGGGSPRSFCLQIGWIVSRGGLPGLVPALAAHLRSADPADRIAAAYLVADAAAYVTEAIAPQFGGGSAPGRDVEWELVEESDDDEFGEVYAMQNVREIEDGGRIKGVQIDSLWSDASSDRAQRVRHEPRVNLGFTALGDPSLPVSPPLEPQRDYWLWVELGPPVEGALPGGSTINTAALPSGAILDVELIPNSGLLLTCKRSGAVQLRQTAEPMPVVRRAEAPPGAAEEALRRRLYFRMRTTDTGRRRLRCCLYMRGLLVHVEEANLVVGAMPRRAASQTKTVFRLTRNLRTSALQTVPKHLLSVYVNDGEDGTHTVVFRTERNDDHPAEKHGTIEPARLSGVLAEAAQALQKVSWGYPTENPASPADYRYEPAPGAADFAAKQVIAADLCALAVAGRKIWNDVFARLTASDEEELQFRDDMRSPGLVQLALRDQTAQLLPLQVCYDWPLETSDPTQLHLCSAAEAYFGIEGPRPDPLVCLTEGCADFDDRLAVCPAGFWGFRHAISVTLSNVQALAFSKVEPNTSSAPLALAGFTQDPRVVPYIEPHLARLKGWFDVTAAYDLAEVRQTLVGAACDVVYFLCHVRNDGSESVVVVGGTSDQGPGIDSSALLDWNFNLRQRRPAVFINACHSAAPSPEKMITLVDRFFRKGASSAVGTEITVFVSLAVPFAEGFLDAWRSGAAFASALQITRVNLLARRNPLGLCYLGFGAPHARSAIAATSV
jgi:hypothetical protein